MRLNQYLAKSGISSRRKADELIKAGKVKVNGQPLAELGYQVKEDDRVEFLGKPID